MAWGRPPASGNWTRPKDPDAAAAASSLALAALDLSATTAVSNPNSMTYSVTDQGSDVWRVSLTGDGSIRDGANEGVSLVYTPKDADGNTIDLTGAKHSVHWQLELDSVSAGDDLLVMVGVVASSGGTAQWVRLSGFSTSSSATRRSVSNSTTSNSTTGTADLDQIRGHYVPVPITGSTWQAGGIVTWTLNSSGEKVNSFQAAPGNGSASDNINLCLFLGFDSAHTSAKTADIKISTAISESWTQ